MADDKATPPNADAPPINLIVRFTNQIVKFVQMHCVKCGHKGMEPLPPALAVAVDSGQPIKGRCARCGQRYDMSAPVIAQATQFPNAAMRDALRGERLTNR